MVGVKVDADGMDDLAGKMEAAEQSVADRAGAAQALLASVGRSADAAAVGRLVGSAETRLAFAATSLRVRSSAARASDLIFRDRWWEVEEETEIVAPPGLADLLGNTDPAETWRRIRQLLALRDHADGRATDGVLGRRESAERRLAELVADFGIAEWQAVTYVAADIDPGSWEIEEGLLANDRIVQKVYDFYSSMYLADHRLVWAGLGGLVGAQFYGGWQDLYTVRHLANDNERAMYVLQLLGIDVPDWTLAPLPAFDPPMKAVPEEILSGALEWLEVQMLDMQRQIFDDLAWQHLAFHVGGVPAVERALGEGGLDGATVEWWRLIDEGSPESVLSGAVGLVGREQKAIIQDEYDAIRGYETGDSFLDGATILSSLLTWLADTPLAGALSYQEAYHEEIIFDLTLDTPFGELHISDLLMSLPLPLDRLPDEIVVKVPVGDVSIFEDRWRWIEEEILPALRDMLDGGSLEEALAIPVVERAEERRIVPLPYPRDLGGG